MVKKFYKRKRVFRKRPYGKKRVYRKRYFKLRPEVKYSVNNDWTAETMDDYTAPSTNFNMMRLTAGTGGNQRIGLRVQGKYLKIRCHTEASAAQNLDAFRVDIWMDRQPDATNPSWSDLYVQGNTATDNLMAPQKDEKRGRFKLLRSKTFNDNSFLSSTTGPTEAPSQHNFTFFISLRNRVIRYNTTGAANPDAGCNIFAIAWSNLTANTPKIWMFTEFCYTDV